MNKAKPYASYKRYDTNDIWQAAQRASAEVATWHPLARSSMKLWPDDDADEGDDASVEPTAEAPAASTPVVP